MDTYFSLANIKPPPKGFTLDEPEKPTDITWKDVIDPMAESAKKLWTGKQGAKIGGKTAVEHIGGYVSDAWKERTETPPAPPMFDEGGLSKEYARGAFENVASVAKKLFGTLPPPPFFP